MDLGGGSLLFILTPLSIQSGDVQAVHWLEIIRVISALSGMVGKSAILKMPQR